jgi:hypothetical protein
MEFIALRIVITMILVCCFLTNINTERSFKVIANIVGGILGCAIVGVWMWF